MLRIISALLLVFSSLALVCPPAWSEPAAPLELAENAPDRHIVVRGDTLWDIAAKFLKEPYRWPEIWRLNQEEIKNPHRIYPGQVLLLDRREAVPRLVLGEMVKVEPRIHSSEERQAIPSIPQQVIEPFLARPLVLDAEAPEGTARIVATPEQRVNIGQGDIAYATGVTDGVKLWNIYRPGKPLVDPETEEVLGVETIFLGSARVIRSGEPATLEIVASTREISRGDQLLPAPRPDIISYVPHAPAASLSARVISVYGSVAEGGRNSIVSLSRGKKDGLEVGHVLALYRSGREVNAYSGQSDTVKLPDERYGLLFVFRVFDRVAYALVMNVSRSVLPGDLVKNP